MTHVLNVSSEEPSKYHKSLIRMWMFWTGFHKIFFVHHRIFFRCDLSVKVHKLIVHQFVTKRPKNQHLSVTELFLSLTDSLCLLQTVYHRQFMSVTDSLCLSKTVCVCHRQFVSHRQPVCHRHQISVKICP